MSAALLAGVAGLALLDALNPATIAGVALLLLAPMTHPVRAAAGFVAGAYLTVLSLGAVVYVGADVAADAAGNVPNAFPYFIAIERIVDAGVAPPAPC